MKKRDMDFYLQIAKHKYNIAIIKSLPNLWIRTQKPLGS